MDNSGGKPQTHKDLIVWKLSIDLVKMVYSITTGLPDDEKFGLSTQMKRAAVSIPSNIAEGAGRKSSKEFVQYLNIASGSLSELETQLIVCRELFNTDIETVIDELVQIRKMLLGLMKSIKSK